MTRNDIIDYHLQQSARLIVESGELNKAVRKLIAISKEKQREARTHIDAARTMMEENR